MNALTAARAGFLINVMLVGAAVYFLIYTAVTNKCKADLDDVNDGSNKCLRAAAAKAEDSDSAINVEKECKEFVDEELAGGDGDCDSPGCKALYEEKIENDCVTATTYDDQTCRTALTGAIHKCSGNMSMDYADKMLYAQIMIGIYALLSFAQSYILWWSQPTGGGEDEEKKD
jgi:hypothetical protein